MKRPASGRRKSGERRGAQRGESKRGREPGAGGRRVAERPRPEPPARRAFPEVERIPPSPLRAGQWLLTTRTGAEWDLIEELAYTSPKARARELAPGLVAAEHLPRRENRWLGVTFARQGFCVNGVVSVDDVDAASRLAHAVLGALAAARRKPGAFALDVWVPDTDEGNVRAGRAAALESAITGELARIAPAWAAQRVESARDALRLNGLSAQVCLLDDHKAAVGVLPARDALSLAPGGRHRVHVPKHAPSRSAMKLVEALQWLDRTPERGELCVDLGAAPGGWSWVLLEHGAFVLAVDPGGLDPSLRSRRGLTHLRLDAFRFEPEETVDWLLCDMAWRPLEAAALMAKWARRGWARMLVANIKLPMKKKAEYLLRVVEILESGGWKNIRTRQLYHDREEITLGAFRV